METLLYLYHNLFWYLILDGKEEAVKIINKCLERWKYAEFTTQSIWAFLGVKLCLKNLGQITKPKLDFIWTLRNLETRKVIICYSFIFLFSLLLRLNIMPYAIIFCLKTFEILTRTEKINLENMFTSTMQKWFFVWILIQFA